MQKQKYAIIRKQIYNGSKGKVKTKYKKGKKTCLS